MLVAENEQVKEFMVANAPAKQRIAYKFNRAVVFDSMFFHQSHPVSSKPGYDLFPSAFAGAAPAPRPTIGTITPSIGTCSGRCTRDYPNTTTS